MQATKICIVLLDLQLFEISKGTLWYSITVSIIAAYGGRSHLKIL